MPTRNPRSVVTFPIVLRELTVLRAENLTPGMRRLTLGGAQLRAFTRDGLDLPELRTEGFDDHVKFFFADDEGTLVLPGQNVSSLDWPADGRPVAKDYTPVRFDPDAGEIDFDFVRHAGGIASTWAERVAPGESAWIAGPKMSHSHPEGVDWLLVVGDETALPAIGRWLAEMPAGTVARVFVEIADDSHRQELPTRADAEVVWLSRDGAPAGTTDLLERAVRDMEWLPGTAYAWVAGETVTLKGIRRHLVTERQVAREHTHITGYWRRTMPAPVAPGDADAHGSVAADHPEQEADDAHERLHLLTDPAPGHAIRAAVTLGLFELVDGGTRDAARLAERTGADPVTLTALLSYLVSIDLLAPDGDGYRLTPVSEELVEDDHSADEYHLGGAQAALDASLSGLVPTLLTGRAGYRTAAGETFVEAMAHDARLAGTARAAVEEEARWIAPGVVRTHDWAAVPEVTAVGPGSGTVVNALVRAFPGLRARVTALPSVLRVLREEILDTDVLPHVELVPQTGAAPAAGTRTLLMCRQLAWLADEDAALLLAETAAALAADGTLLLVEQVTAADPDDADAPLDHLRLKCAFGSGVRDVAGLTDLAERAGLAVGACHDIGWDHRLWVLTAPGPAPR